MKNKIENLRDLFIEQGRELFDALKQEQKELPEIKKMATNLNLKKIIDSQLASAKDQRIRLNDAFNNLEENIEGESNECCKAIFNHSKQLLNRSKDPRIQDAVIVNTIQKLNHNNINGLGTFISFASQIGHQEIANTLHKSLDQEKAVDKELSSLAKAEINREAEIGALR